MRGRLCPECDHPTIAHLKHGGCLATVYIHGPVVLGVGAVLKASYPCQCGLNRLGAVPD